MQITQRVSRDTQMIHRLHRAEGQMHAITSMIETGAPTADVLIQLAAIRGAIDSIGLLLIEERLRDALAERTEFDSHETLVSECCSAIKYTAR